MSYHFAKADTASDIARLMRLNTQIERELGREINQAFVKLRNRMTAGELAELIDQGGAPSVLARLAGIEEDDELFGKIRDVTEGAADKAARIKGGTTYMGPDGREVPITYDPVSAQVRSYGRRVGDLLIRELSDDQRNRAAEIIRQSTLDGLTSVETAKRYREFIGLTRAQQGHVANYRRQLESRERGALDRVLRDRRYDARVRNAIKDDSPLTAEQIDKMVERYRDRYVKYRSQVIARTEATKATQGGQHRFYEAHVQDGRLRPDQVTRYWIHSADGRVRDPHLSAPVMNPDGVKLDEPFMTPLGPLMFPGDPAAVAANIIQCRCVVDARVTGDLAPVTPPKPTPPPPKPTPPGDDEKRRRQRERARLRRERQRRERETPPEPAPPPRRREQRTTGEGPPASRQPLNPAVVFAARPEVERDALMAFILAEDEIVRTIRRVVPIRKLVRGKGSHYQPDNRTLQMTSSYKGETFSTVFRHEYGHHVDAMLQQQERGQARTITPALRSRFWSFHFVQEMSEEAEELMALSPRMRKERRRKEIMEERGLQSMTNEVDDLLREEFDVPAIRRVRQLREAAPTPNDLSREFEKRGLRFAEIEADFPNMRSSTDHYDFLRAWDERDVHTVLKMSQGNRRVVTTSGLQDANEAATNVKMGFDFGHGEAYYRKADKMARRDGAIHRTSLGNYNEFHTAQFFANWFEAMGSGKTYGKRFFENFYPKTHARIMQKVQER